LSLPSDGNRLLIVSAHFPPDRSAGTHRVLRLANYLQAHGWETSVLTIDPSSYGHSIQQDESLVGRIDPRVTIVRTGAWRGHAAMVRWRNRLLRRGGQAHAGTGARDTASRDPRSQDARSQEKSGWRAWRRAGTTHLFGFPDDEIGWFWYAVVRGLQVIRKRKIDVVLSSAPPFTCHLVGHALRSLANVRWVADFRDPWARAPWGKGGSARGHQWLESRVIGRADAVALNTPELHREFTDWYGPDLSARFHVVTNGYDADVLEPYARAAPGTGLPLIITHAGTLYRARDPRPLLEALARCMREGAVPQNGIHLNFVGKIASAFEVDSVIERLGLSGCVTRQPPVPHHESLRLLAASHVLVVIQPDTSLQVPVKLYEYVGLRRPILALAEDGAVARLVRDGNFGVVVPPADVDGIATALADLYRRHITQGPATVDDQRAAQFDARRQSAILAEVLSGLVAPTTPGLVTRSVRP
jgi:glycosyltransferase involved in cell wall biosynthesis